MYSRISIALAFVLAAPVAAPADPVHVHYDLSPVLIGGKIAVEGISHLIDGKRYWSPPRRVFEYEFGGNPLFPRRTDHPGINREPGTTAFDSAGSPVLIGGTGLPAGSILSITFTHDLLYWTGAGFGPVPGAETLTFSFGDTRTLGTGTGRLEPLPIHLFGPDSLHYHLIGNLYGPSGNPTAPTPGVYLVSARLESSSPAVEASDEFWMVYAYRASEEDHAAAAAWVEANLVPEPAATLAGCVWMAWLAMIRRHRAQAQ